jgi:hypothetical protein
MNLLSLITFALMLALLLGTGILVARAVLRNLRIGLRFRYHLAQRVEQLRLHRMLKSLGIDVSSYLHEQPVNAIEAHIQQCGGCQTQTRCDERFAGVAAAEDDISFCPNSPSLTRMRAAADETPAVGR